MTWPPDPNAPTEPHVRAFFDDIADHPDDPAVRFVFADWLEDRDDPRAELLRLQGQYLQAGTYDERHPVQERIRAWCERYNGDWHGKELPNANSLDLASGELKLWADFAEEVLTGPKRAGFRRALREGWMHKVTIFDWNADQLRRGGQLGLYAGPHDLSFAFCGVREDSLEVVRDHLRLRHFMAMGNDLNLSDAALAPLGTLTGLQRLNLCSLAHLTGAGLASLAPLHNLRWLQVGSCPQVSDAGLQHLPALPAVVDLFLGDARSLVGPGLERLQVLPMLRNLYLSRGPLLGEAALVQVGRLRGLRKLYLDDCAALTDAGLAHLSGLRDLEALSLNDCGQLTGRGIAHLHGLTHLTTLSLRGVSLKGHETRALRKALPGCTVVRK